jgi:hypothetical protein
MSQYKNGHEKNRFYSKCSLNLTADTTGTGRKKMKFINQIASFMNLFSCGFVHLFLLNVPKYVNFMYQLTSAAFVFENAS